MTISRELFLSILAMDSYHQGYDPGMVHGKSNIGGATVRSASADGVSVEDYARWQEQGFYAVSYDVNATGISGWGGETFAISYRGTDGAPDFTRGWTMGGGFTGWNQSSLALDFFTSATGQTMDAQTGLPGYRQEASNAILTGHSLGGGLAGFVSALSGTEGVGYDNMPFSIAAFMQDIADQRGLGAEGQLSPAEFISTLRDLLDSMVRDGGGVGSGDANFAFDGINSTSWLEISTKNEILESVRNGDFQLFGGALGPIIESLVETEVAQEFLAADPDLADYINFLADNDSMREYGNLAADLTYIYQRHVQNTSDRIVYDATIDPFFTDLADRALVLHMIDLLTLLRFSAEKSNNAQPNSDPEIEKWRYIAREFMEAYFDNEIDPNGPDYLSESIAVAAGFTNIAGKATTSAKMRHAIAYSALEESSGLVFGNTGIRAMVDDIDELGSLHEATGLVRFQNYFNGPKNLFSAVSEAIVQFAGQMALQEVDFKQHTDLRPEQGILTFTAGGAHIDFADDPDDETASADLMLINLSSHLWELNDSGTNVVNTTREVGRLGHWIKSALWATTQDDQLLDPEEATDSAFALTGLPQILRAVYGEGDDDRQWQLTGVVGRFIREVQIAIDNASGEEHLAERKPAQGDNAAATEALFDMTASLFISADVAQTVYGSNDNTIFLLSDADDEVHLSLRKSTEDKPYDGSGQDIVFGRLGADKVVDYFVEDQKRNDEGRDIDDIFYATHREIAAEEVYQSVVSRSVDDAENDEYRYSALLEPTQSDALAELGLELTDVSLRTIGDGTFGGAEFVQLSIVDRNGGDRSDPFRDLFHDVETIILSEKSDLARVQESWLSVPQIIDFGAFEKGPVTQQDFDELDFSALGRGIEIVNGSLRLHDGGDEAPRQGDLMETYEMVFGHALDELLPGFDPLETETPLTLMNVEKFTGTAQGDTFIQAAAGIALDSFGNWAEDNRPGAVAHINSGAGNDNIYVINPGYFDKDAPIPESKGGAEGGGTTAKGELRTKLDAGAGDDWIVVKGGKKALTVGGDGEDWIYNTSAGGEIYGDTNLGDGSGSGTGDSDLIWWAPGVTMKDPDENDYLRYFDRPLIGGAQNLPLGPVRTILLDAIVSVSGFATYKSEIYYDYLTPHIQYQQVGDEFFVINRLPGATSTGGETWGAGAPSTGNSMRFQNFEQKTTMWGIAFAEGFDEGEQPINAWTGLREVVSGNVTFNVNAGGDMSMLFKDSNPVLDIISWIPGFPGGLTRWIPMIEHVLVQAGASALRAKNLQWGEGNDPLVIDLDGDGIETSAIGDLEVYFDLDGDFFAERTGWLDADDGFLALDRNGDGLISDITELFGGPGLSGFAELRDYDDNDDGVITVEDAIWADLTIWRDFDQDAQTDAGELSSLDSNGITRIDAWGQDMGDFVTPAKTRLLREGDVTFADGRVTKLYDAIFDASETFTAFRGEIGITAAPKLESRGFGNLVNLDVAMANDLELADIARAAADGMTTIDMRTLRAEVGETLSLWGFAQAQSRELTPVRIGDVDGTQTVLDRAIWVEDATGGYWQLASGAPVLDAGGVQIDRPTMADVLALEGGWQITQAFSPATRAAALEHRSERPFLVEVIDGVATVLDWGTQQPDGSWQLASGTPITDAQGAPIAAPTLEEVLAQAATVGQQWRAESFGFNPLNDVAVQEIGVRQVDGIVTDYTVEITDQNGTFHVWARNVDRALELQAKYGTAQEFNLRNFEIDFDTLDEVNSTDDSQFRVEILTPGQMNFALAFAGFEFQPQMLSGTIDAQTGVLSYTVSPRSDTGIAGPDGYVSGINQVIALLDEVVPNYIQTANGYAMRLAFQGGLADFAQGIAYDAQIDAYRPTTDEELIPVFDAIFKALPGDYQPAVEYLQSWAELLAQVIPDYAPSGENNDGGQSVRADKVFVLQNLIPAFERNASPLDLAAAMYAMQLDEGRLRMAADETVTEVLGTTGTDYFYLADGDQTLLGGDGEDAYFAGELTGHDTITDYDDGDLDDLRLTGVTPDDVTFERKGQDLVISYNDLDKSITVNDHFLGELNPLLAGGRQDSGVNHIVFGDGTVYDRFRISLEVSEERDTFDEIIGSGSADVLRAGLGNDIMRGGAGGTTITTPAVRT
ncbi:hypothetical protein KDD17_04285 [Sulfitobacter albidus]|uniref:Tandem-95 repeat protein n=1 Tax=Sulfitobacter albidus TaxID=2829501 RepID=A0A975JF06_9RHOB|nr:hypothetical protein [Sulfitobacter albidus]QUJ77243.1 hypothetical protein KDD17_04285 [Sulfitobacter albidus]